MTRGPASKDSSDDEDGAKTSMTTDAHPDDENDERAAGPDEEPEGRALSPMQARLIRWGITSMYVMIAVVVVALVRTFIAQSFIIPSGSMEDTLVQGDRVLVTMYDSTDIERGDVVVFTDPDHWLSVSEPTGISGLAQSALETLRILPQDSGHHLIKRVIGLPGDHIVADGQGALSINGTPVEEPYLKPGRSPSDVAFDVVVPEGHVWVMGDNRANSADSRFHRGDAHDGFVPLEDVIGVAKSVVWPVSHWSGLGQGRQSFDGVPGADASARAPQRWGPPVPPAPRLRPASPVYPAAPGPGAALIA